MRSPHLLRRLVAVLGLVGLALALATPRPPAEAQTLFEKLVMPGELIKGHLKEEKDCGNCHVPFARHAQSSKCLDCHKDVAADRKGTRGFHGRDAQAAKAECRTCHGDHKGRDADIVGLDKETFNHASTEFKLVAGHARAPCGSCHATGVKFRKAPSKCNDCHKTIDPHHGRLGDKCETCHSVEPGWKKTSTFDHGKTKFPLRDAHAKVTCQACHTGERYKDLATDCASCHRLQDAHHGRYGAKCESCHTAVKWPEARFDHGRTKFPLAGQHARTRCDACHSGDLYADKLPLACVGCHKKDDPHKGQLGDTCERCHKDTGWRGKVAFNHELSRFPLIGLHAAVPCEECHRSASYKSAPRDCAGCHKDEHHAGRLGPACGKCHNPNGWALWRFDHDRQTKYPLTGAHRGLDCAACHKQTQVPKAIAPKDCYACHSGDDAHQGAFGRACETCHTTTRFRQVRARD